MKLIEEYRIRRYNKNLSARNVAAEVLNDCVVAVVAGANAPKREVLRELKVKVKVEDKSPIQVPRKRKHKWNTWHDKGFAIYMLLHPKIFDGDSALASIYLGIARSTLLGYISTSVKTSFG